LVVARKSASALTTYDLSPQNGTIASGDSILDLIEKDADGVKTDSTAEAVFTVNDPIGNVNGNQYNAGRIGTWTVTAKIDGETLVTTVTVTAGELAELVIKPMGDVVTVTAGEKIQFSATGYDAHRNKVAVSNIDWSGAFSIGELSKNGLFTSTQVGSSQIIATVGNIFATTTVKVDPQAPVKAGQDNQNNTAATEETKVDKKPAEDETGSEEAPAEEVVARVATEKENEGECKDFSWWGWLLAIIIFMAIIHGYHYLIKNRKSNKWLIGSVIITAAAIWSFYAFRCGTGDNWVVWLLIISAIIVTLMRPKSFKAQYGEDL
jgi:hypothetical protein